ncbi:MAG: 23S rRNA (uracil(1939)-C(5))-methyltransferase RlmD [FCB group bacterium]|nr:23S rRNA (uracil(1939)-C(5))-methyltransferase RlmD [FCB group bacterium]MBL7028320.1 23S rRNA (uracil(1939)-C(5))-methyltransferase RlmD [Candidatus Neomarinimicrobiota bacterium]MBL7121639.1 23S rRNA (uracil(1939)-C(5))-methyltransferase RlmD [Candidatus Neomarinimicrobiota bacterium]
MNDAEQRVVKKGDSIELEIESLAFGGKGVAKVDGLAIFVERTIPGQKVLARIVKKKKSFAEAYPLEILKKAPNEIEAKCPAFGTCGGCRLQNLKYDDQLLEKTRQVRDLVQRVGGFADFEVPTALPSPTAFHYRNKMEFTFTPSPWRNHPDDEDEPLGLGQHIPGRFDKIVHIETCYLQKPIMNEIMNFVFAFAKEHGWEGYNNRTHEGWARNLVLRYGEHTDEIMVNLVTKTYEKEHMKVFTKAIMSQFPQITTLINSITARLSDVAVGETEVFLHGPGHISDRLGESDFEISANSFFQTNTLQAEVLYGEALKGTDLKGGEVVYDLYCGTGTIALFLAKQAKKVYGFELIASSVKNARRNAKAQGFENVEFILGDLKDVLSQNVDRIEPADVIVVDPPRAGLHQNVVDDILKVGPQKLVYVSCNPSTLARDLKLFCETDYELVSVQPVDMFPHTTHIETVAQMVKKATA